MLQSGLCDYSDAYIVVKGTINVADPNDARNKYGKKLALKIMLHLLAAEQCRKFRHYNAYVQFH